jgi:hypothetical protein
MDLHSNVTTVFCVNSETARFFSKRELEKFLIATPVHFAPANRLA